MQTLCGTIFCLKVLALDFDQGWDWQWKRPLVKFTGNAQTVESQTLLSSVVSSADLPACSSKASLTTETSVRNAIFIYLPIHMTVIQLHDFHHDVHSVRLGDPSKTLFSMCSLFFPYCISLFYFPICSLFFPHSISRFLPYCMFLLFPYVFPIFRFSLYFHIFPYFSQFYVPICSLLCFLFFLFFPRIFPIFHHCISLILFP